MIIENTEDLKLWLTSCLSRICDAEPTALANYVLALVKKEKSEAQLKEFCIDQLDIFLLKDTKAFVDMLFEALKTKSYLNKAEPQENTNSIENSNSTNFPVSKSYHSKKDVKSDSEKDSFQNSDTSVPKRVLQSSPPRERTRPSHTSPKNISYSRDRSRSRDTDDRRSYYDEKEKYNRVPSKQKLQKSDHEKYGVENPVYRPRKNSNLSHSSPPSSRSCSRERLKENSESSWAKEKAQKRHQIDHCDTDMRIKDSNILRNYSNITRCKDYDEKGFCMRGDLCLYDHGVDPVVVEDVSVLNFGVPPPHTLNHVASNDAVTSIMSECQESSTSPLPPLPPSPPPLPPPPPPTLPPLPTTGAYIPEPYNPEAPGMNLTYHADDQTNFWMPPNAGIHIPPHHSLRSEVSSGLQNVQLSHNPKALRSRELIVVNSTNFSEENSKVPDESVESSENLSNFNNNLKKRKSFDYSRLGPKPKRLSLNRTLELRKIPKHLNTIATLNGHFSKFGTIVNLKVSFEDDPEAALIQFSNHSEAAAAYKCSEPVLNNRFIRVFWHKDNDSPTEKKVSSPEKPVLQNTQNTKMLVKNFSDAKEKTFVQKTDKLPNVQERSIIYSSRGSLCRTVFNPAVLKKNKDNVTPIIPSVVPRTKEDKKEAIKKKLELHNKKQSFLELQLNQQKLILQKLNKSKNDKERAELKQILTDLATKITSLQADVKKSAEDLKNFLKKGGIDGSNPEKELLDAEMDLFNKQQSGDDYTELLAKVNELKQRAKACGLIDAAGHEIGLKVKRVHPKFLKKDLTKTTLSRKIDNRPKKILISGSSLDKEVLIKHFTQFGTVVRFETCRSGYAISFSTRKAAEMALVNGYKLGTEILKLSWYKEDQQSGLDNLSDNNAAKLQEDNIHLLYADEDEEEEEDSEARSWRR